MSPLLLSTIANNSLCASGTLNFAIVSSKSLQKATAGVGLRATCGPTAPSPSWKSDRSRAIVKS